MRSLPLFNFPAFHAAAADLRRRGYRVRSPAEHDERSGFDPAANSLEGFSLEAAMRWDIKAVLWCDAVCVLPGWRGSTGVALETVVARGVGTPILEYPNMEPPSESALLEAERLVNGARQSTYGHPFDDFSRTASIWRGILGIEVTPEQVALCMIGVKMSRLCTSPAHRDSYVDIAGYAGTYEKVAERRQEQ